MTHDDDTTGNAIANVAEVAVESLKIFERIATYKANGISDTALCESFGFQPLELREIYSNSAYQEIEAKILQEKIDENLEVDQSWDSLEAKALENLTKALKVNRDPELSLRVAAVANKAVRRTRGNNAILDAGKAEGARATIKLTQRMISKLGDDQNRTEVSREVSAQVDVTNEELVEIFTGDAMCIPTLSDSDE